MYKKDAQILVNQGESSDGVGHNKFWCGFIDDTTFTVHTKWGRLGTKGQQQSKQFGSLTQCSAYLNKKSTEKRRSGYTNKFNGIALDQTMLDKLHTEAAMVGSGNKLNELSWVEETSDGFKTISTDRLYDPACTPLIVVSLTTRKEYNGRTQFIFIFGSEKTYLASTMPTNTPRKLTTKPVDKSDSYYELIEKVEQAIGTRLSVA